MKQIVLLTFILYTALCFSQVGINQQSPQPGALHIDAKGNTPAGTPAAGDVTDDVLIDNNGNVSIGHISPTNKLHLKLPSGVSNAVKIEDGSQSYGLILRSDRFGRAFWGHAGDIQVVQGVLGAGRTLTTKSIYDDTGIKDLLYLNAYIDLPPGQWLVMVNMVTQTNTATAGNYSNYLWLRSSFADAAVDKAPVSSDITGAYWLSGLAFEHTPGMMEGFIVIENSGTTTKRYYYGMGWADYYADPLPSNAQLVNFASKSVDGNLILAFKMKDL